MPLSLSVLNLCCRTARADPPGMNSPLSPADTPWVPFTLLPNELLISSNALMAIPSQLPTSCKGFHTRAASSECTCKNYASTRSLGWDVQHQFVFDCRVNEERCYDANMAHAWAYH